MLSPSNLARRVGVGGGLVPFFKCVCVYFVAFGEAEYTPGLAAVAAKCAPVLCLLAAVLLLPPRPADPIHPIDPEYEKHNRRYARLVGSGLAASALGDACLVWPAQLVAGMALFGAAHACYIAAFCCRRRAAARAAGAGWLAAAALYCALLPAPPALRLLAPPYAALLAAMAWRALATLPPASASAPASARALAAPLGALLFVLSDAVLGYTLFKGPVPHKQVVVMSTYYLGQLGIALSALLPPAPPAPPAPAPAPAPAR